jgi:hypothetical protein
MMMGIHGHRGVVGGSTPPKKIPPGPPKKIWEKNLRKKIWEKNLRTKNLGKKSLGNLGKKSLKFDIEF